MMKQMLEKFGHVDGAGIVPNKLEYARCCLENGTGFRSSSFNLFQLNDVAGMAAGACSYDFIHSTICIHHIAPFDFRDEIYGDIWKQLKPDEQFPKQVAFRIDTGIHWWDNLYAKNFPLSTVDVSIPDAPHLAGIERWLRNIGFDDVSFRLEYCAHQVAAPELKWLFIDGKNYDKG